LLKGGSVLSLDKTVGNFHQADLLIEGSKIVAVGPNLSAGHSEIIDCSDSIVMPGFVDTHRHAWESLLRNLGDSGGNTPIPRDGVSAAVYGHHYQPDDVYAATLIGLLGAIEAGITTVVDWSDIQVDGAYSDAALQAHADAGLRTVFVHSVPTWAGTQDDAGSALRSLVTGRADAARPSTNVAFGSAEPVRVDLERVARDWALARELGLRIHMHAGSKTSDRGLVSNLSERRLLGADVTLVHCSNLDDLDFDAIAASRASVSLTPSSEMAGGLGLPPIQKLIDRSIRPGLGVDSERISPGDLFAQMRAAISLQHATLFNLKLAGKAGLPQLLSTREVIRYATIDGAQVAGLGDVTGSLVPGKQADIVVLRTDRPNVFPINDPIGAVVWGMDTSNVDWVFVGGQPVMRLGALGVDVDRARKLAITAQHRVAAASGLELAASLGGSR
jgi:cytosine/adenosine deaminase-related metal-dependent hydrolase